MSIKPYAMAVRVLLDDQIDEGPVYSLADMVLSALSRAGVPVVSILITEGDEL